MYWKYLFGYLFMLLKTVPAKELLPTTISLISDLGYPVEHHEVFCSDYKYGLFRIPYSPNLQNHNVAEKPVALVQPGLETSSSIFLLIGNHSLPFHLSDAGYDVWLSNNRGNPYCKEHRYYSESDPRYWDFSWDDIGIDDFPCVIDYVLLVTQRKNLHFIGQSQGSTSAFALLSTKPEYNVKFKTFLAMGAYVYFRQTTSIFFKVLSRLLGKPFLTQLVGPSKFLPNPDLFHYVGGKLCKDASPVQFICSNTLFLLFGLDLNNMNKTSLSTLLKTTPVDASAYQFIHFMQMVKFGEFQRYDYGSKRNIEKYGYSSPPKFNLNNVKANVHLFYTLNDPQEVEADVLLLYRQLPNAFLHRVSKPEYTHLDYIYGKDVGEVLYKPMIDVMNAAEMNYNYV